MKGIFTWGIPNQPKPAILLGGVYWYHQFTRVPSYQTQPQGVYGLLIKGTIPKGPHHVPYDIRLIFLAPFNGNNETLDAGI